MCRYLFLMGSEMGAERSNIENMVVVVIGVVSLFDNNELQKLLTNLTNKNDF